MVLHGIRMSTQDVDIIPLNFPPSPHIKTKEASTTTHFKKCVKAVAKRFHLRQDWLNDVASMFLSGLGPEPEWRYWRSYGPLEIYLPPKEYILAAAYFADRPQDATDIKSLQTNLNIRKREQAQELLNRYIYERWQKEYRIFKTLDRIFL